MKDIYSKISVVVPCLNEQAFVEQAIRDIIRQDYPLKQMEVFLIDGGSTDGSLRILQKYAKRYRQIRLLENPGTTVPHALNAAIKKATGEVLIRMDARASYPPYYVSGLLYWLHVTEAESVGGSWHIQSKRQTLVGQAIAQALGHPFGAGFASYKQGFLEYEEEVETVPFGCYPKEVFTKYGLFHEGLGRSYELEFNKRIARADGLVLLVPEVYCVYYSRDTYLRIWNVNFNNGYWIRRAMQWTGHRDIQGHQHRAVVFLVLYVVLAVGVSFFIPFTPFSVFVFFPALIYIFLIGRACISIAIGKQKLELLPFVAIAFWVIHVSHALGNIYGMVKGLFLKKKGN